jgi:single-stranded-DNA-specific exonuclease
MTMMPHSPLETKLQTEKQWIIHPAAGPPIRDQFPEVHPIVLQLLVNRRVTTPEAVTAFLNSEYTADLHDPFLFRDMRRAVDRIQEAIASRQKIVVHGDYDADGVCGSVVLVTTLQALGADVDVYIPDRANEGYGVNLATIESLAQKGCKLLITTDCGTSSVQEIQRANELGMDVIVTDHHQPPADLPPALALLNPQVAGEPYPFKFLSGSGVAFKLADALVRADAQTKLPAGFEKWLLDVVALSTVTDIMPLVGENRVLVKYGLIVIRKTRRRGLRALLRFAGSEIAHVNTTTLGFVVGPRINAAGRLDHALTAFQLLMTDDPQEAERLAMTLEQTNRDRQSIARTMTDEAKAQLQLGQEEAVCVTYNKSWSVGVVGLVAGRLCETFGKPTFVFTEHAGKLIGSGRSVKTLDITKLLRTMEDQFERFGGHAQACGLTLKQEMSIETFRQKVNEAVGAIADPTALRPQLLVDAEIPLEEVTWELFEALEALEPFGEANPLPVFLSSSCTIVGVQAVGKDGRHLQLRLAGETPAVKKCIGFDLGDWGSRLSVGDTVDVVYQVSVNEWNGNRELQLKILDLHQQP